jgi:hypothetical protein
MNELHLLSKFSHEKPDGPMNFSNPSIQVARPIPKWDPKKLSEHVEKRSNVDTGCLESLLGLSRPLLNGDLRALSEKVYNQPRLIFSAQTKDEFGVLRDTRCHFVNASLVMAITNLKRSKFYTCYHLHKNPTIYGSCPGYPRNEEESQKSLLYEKERLRRINNSSMRGLKFLQA